MLEIENFIISNRVGSLSQFNSPCQSHPNYWRNLFSLTKTKLSSLVYFYLERRWCSRLKLLMIVFISNKAIIFIRDEDNPTKMISFCWKKWVLSMVGIWSTKRVKLGERADAVRDNKICRFQWQFANPREEILIFQTSDIKKW